jgi:aryl-alcohol dehydrogenase-like predicted oxidoreductase
MALTDFVSLGRSGPRASPLALGTMTFGEEWGWGASVETSEAILHGYLERGGNFIDAANIYTRGHSEVIVGNLLARTLGLRDRVVLATKFGATLDPADPNAGGFLFGDATIDGVRHQRRPYAPADRTQAW